MWPKCATYPKQYWRVNYYPGREKCFICTIMLVYSLFKRVPCCSGQERGYRVAGRKLALPVWCGLWKDKMFGQILLLVESARGETVSKERFGNRGNPCSVLILRKEKKSPLIMVWLWWFQEFVSLGIYLLFTNCFFFCFSSKLVIGPRTSLTRLLNQRN